MGAAAMGAAAGHAPGPLALHHLIAAVGYARGPARIFSTNNKVTHFLGQRPVSAARLPLRRPGSNAGQAAVTCMRDAGRTDQKIDSTYPIIDFLSWTRSYELKSTYV